MWEFLGGVILAVLASPFIFGFVLGYTAGSRRGKEQVVAAFAAIEEAKAVLAKYKEEADATIAKYHEETLQDLLTESPGRDVHYKGN